MSAYVLPKCDGWCEGKYLVTHIGSKGYAYCGECAERRRESGYESTRQMRAWETDLLAQGKPLPSYAPISLETARIGSPELFETKEDN